MGFIPWFLFLLLCCWSIKMQHISVHWFYILQLCWIHGSVLAVFFCGIFWVFHDRVSCQLRRVKVKPPLGQFGCFLFLCVVWLLRLRLPILCWITVARVNIPVLFLTVGGKLCFSPLRMILALGLSYMAFMISRHDPSIPTFLKVFIVCCQMVSLHLLRGSYGSCPFFYWCVNHINCFANIEPGLHPRYKSHLVVMNNFFNVLLDPVG